MEGEQDGGGKQTGSKGKITGMGKGGKERVVV